jgi:hypothetical protein
MNCTTDGITHEGFEEILYVKYRSGKAQADLDKCKQWAAMPASERQSHEDKSCAQPWTVEKTMFITHTCDVCKRTMPVGASILRCARCNFDICATCAPDGSLSQDLAPLSRAPRLLSMEPEPEPEHLNLQEPEPEPDAAPVDAAAVSELVSWGFDEESVRAALAAAAGDKQVAANMLLG